MILQVVGSICISNDPPSGGLKRRSGLKKYKKVGLGIAQLQEAVDGQIPMNPLALKNLVLRQIAEENISHHTCADVFFDDPQQTLCVAAQQNHGVRAKHWINKRDFDTPSSSTVPQRGPRHHL